MKKKFLKKKEKISRIFVFLYPSPDLIHIFTTGKKPVCRPAVRHRTRKTVKSYIIREFDEKNVVKFRELPL